MISVVPCDWSSRSLTIHMFRSGAFWMRNVEDSLSNFQPGRIAEMEVPVHDYAKLGEYSAAVHFRRKFSYCEWFWECDALQYIGLDHLAGAVEFPIRQFSKTNRHSKSWISSLASAPLSSTTFTRRLAYCEDKVTCKLSMPSGTTKAGRVSHGSPSTTGVFFQ